MAGVLSRVKLQAKPGVSTLQLAELADQEIRAVGAESAFYGYHGFPGTICISLNEEVVHGIPSPDRIMQSEDLVKIDIGLRRHGFYADMAETVYLGDKIPPALERLMATTQKALSAGIENCVAGQTLGKVSQSIQAVIEIENLSVVKRFVGHGIGRNLHEKPPVPNFGPSCRGPRLEVGMVLAIEPIASCGSPEVAIKQDGWTAVTVDGALTAHFEHTVAITSQGPVILTSTCHAGRKGYES